MEKKYDIFISYSRKDIEKVRPIIDELEVRDFKVWFDLLNIDYGDTFPDRIAEALDASDSLLFMCTPNSLVAPYCKKEIGYARTNGKTIRAILIEGVMPKKGWFALGYQDVNCINITQDEQRQKFLEDIELIYQPEKAKERKRKIEEAKEVVRRMVREEEQRKLKEAEQKALEEELARLRQKEDKRASRKAFYLGVISQMVKTKQNIIHFLLQIYLFVKSLGIGLLCTLCKIKKRAPIVYFPLILVFIVLTTVYLWRNKYDLFPGFFSLEERLGYAEVGENVDGYRLVKTYGGKLAFIQAEKPWGLCTDTIFTENTAMKDSVAWLKNPITSTWSCFYAGKIRDVSHYTQIVEFTNNDTIAFFLFNKEVINKHFLPNSEYNALCDKIRDIKQRNTKSSSNKQSTGGNISSVSNSNSMLDSLSQKIALYSNTNIPSLTDTLTIDSLKMHYGVISKSGDILIPPVLDRIGEHTREYVVARCNGLWGLVNYESHKLPEFEFENRFSYEQRQYANVKRNGKWGLIDKNSKVIIKTENDSIGDDFYDNLILVKHQGLCGFKDIKDKFVIKPIYKEALNFNNGYAAVKDKNTNKWFYVNKKNKPLSISINGITISEPYFDKAGRFYREWYDENDTIILARINIEGKVGFIRLYENNACDFICCKYDELSTLCVNGRHVKGFSKYKKNGKFGILYYSSEITAPIYESISWTQCLDLFKIQMNNNYGVVKLENGNVITVVPTIYEDLEYYRIPNKYFHIIKNNKWGLFDISNKKEIIPCNYDKQIEIKEKGNYCIIKKEESQYYTSEGLYSINEHREILPCKYLSISFKGDNLLEVHGGKKIGIYDLKQMKWIGNGLIYSSVSFYTDKVGLQDETHKWTYYPIRK